MYVIWDSNGGFYRLLQFDVFPTPLKTQYQTIRTGMCVRGERVRYCMLARNAAKQKFRLHEAAVSQCPHILGSSYPRILASSYPHILTPLKTQHEIIKTDVLYHHDDIVMGFEAEGIHHHDDTSIGY